MRLFMKRIYAVIIMVCLTACARPDQSSNTILEKIMTYQDNRASADSLYPFLRHSNPFLSMRAIIALGQLQDTSAIDTLMLFAMMPKTETSQKALFALGQIGWSSFSIAAQTKIEAFLLSLCDQTTNHFLKPFIIEALGKTGSARSLDLLANALHDTLINVRKEASLACARLGIKNITSEKTYPGLILNLNHDHADLRWISLYALMRIHDKKTAASILPSLKDRHDYVRMDAARALGLMKLEPRDPDYKEVVQALVVCAFNDSDWKVRVNAINALANFKFKHDDLKKIYFLIAFEGKKDPNPHVRISAIRAMAKSYDKDIKDINIFFTDFTGRFLQHAEPLEKGEMIVALAQMFQDKILIDKSMSEQIGLLLQHPEGYLRSRIIEALGFTASPLALNYLESALQDSFGLVQNNALESLSKIKDPRAENLIIRSLQTSDLTLLSIAAGIVSSIESVRKNKIRCDSLSQMIIRSFSGIIPPIDIEGQTAVFDALGELKSAVSEDFLKPYLADSNEVVVQSALKNLEKITGEKLKATARPDKKMNPVDFVFFIKLKDRKPSAVIETNRGTILLDFYPDEAPMTVMNFVRLSESGFFNRLRFHRVVPNFVIQGGDPLGTGWGGPGYSIRSEFSSLHYDRGTVGMASAGKDTEGCQWFITHSPQPHLDGRYTIFAKVRQGMDVVDAIQVGDTILQIKIVWH